MPVDAEEGSETPGCSSSGGATPRTWWLGSTPGASAGKEKPQGLRPPAKQRALDPLGRGEVADVLHHGGVYPPRRPRVGRQHRPTRGWEVAEGRPAADGGDPEGADGGEGLLGGSGREVTAPFHRSWARLV